jgi:hypothetical protein
MTDSTMFEQLVERWGALVDRTGEAHCDCPFCGKEAAKGQTHFSFSERGGYCFVCQGKASLGGLARMAGLLDSDQHWSDVPRERTKPKPRSRGRTLDQAFLNRMLDVYEQAPSRVEAWNVYKPLTQSQIAFYHLGYGSYPEYTSQCPHLRLQVPFIGADGVIYGFRGRAVEAHCEHPKWISPVGTGKFLYNAGRFYSKGGIAPDDRPTKGNSLYIVENPIDAGLFEAMLAEVVPNKPPCVVSTQGVTMWDDEWTEAIIKAEFKSVVVCYDNDAPGNGGGAAGVKAWKAKYHTEPPLNGLKLVERFNTAGYRFAYLYDWGDARPKADIGDVVTEYWRRKGDRDECA